MRYSVRKNRLQKIIKAHTESYCSSNGYNIHKWVDSDTVAINDLPCSTAGWAYCSNLRKANGGHTIRNADFWLRKEWSPRATTLIGRDSRGRLFALNVSDCDMELTDPIGINDTPDVHYLGRVDLPTI